MERTPVLSSNIAAIGYDPTTSVLEIEFHSGSVYQYYDVPEHEAAALTGATSIGSYHATHIKGVYRYARV